MLQHPGRPGVRPAVLDRRVFHPQESGGGGVSYLSNMQRKIVYARRHPADLHRDLPLQAVPPRRGRKKDLGEATIGEVDTGSFVLKLFLLGGFRGMAANVLWTRAIDFQKVQEWDKLKVTVDMITKLQPHFLVDLDLPELEPDVQRLGRVGRPRRQVRVDQARDQVRPGRRQEEPEVARPDLGHGVVLLPQDRLLRRVDHPPPPVPRRRGRELQEEPDRRQHLSRQLPARPRLVRQGRQARRLGRGTSVRRQTPSRVDGARRRPAQRKGRSRATCRSAPCPPTPRPGTPSAWRRRA